MAKISKTLRDFLSRGGIEGRVFTDNRACPYEAKGIVLCRNGFGENAPYLLARRENPHKCQRGPTELWFYTSLEETWNNPELKGIELPSSDITFKKQLLPEGFFQLPLDEIGKNDSKDNSETSKRLKRIFPMVRTVGDLLDRYYFELYQPKGMGLMTVNRIMAYVGQFGLGLRQS